MVLKLPFGRKKGLVVLLLILWQLYYCILNSFVRISMWLWLTEITDINFGTFEKKNVSVFNVTNLRAPMYNNLVLYKDCLV